jgi:hypothetical protein
MTYALLSTTATPMAGRLMQAAVPVVPGQGSVSTIACVGLGIVDLHVRDDATGRRAAAETWGRPPASWSFAML